MPESQPKILERAVNFQGSNVALNKLMTPDSSFTKALKLADLLKEKSLKIGKNLPVLNGYDEAFYIDRTFNQPTTNPNRPPKNLNDFLQQAEHPKVMIIADTVGMGKSTVLTHLSLAIKKANSYHWVERIDLNNHLELFVEQKRKAFTKDSATEFLSKLINLLDNSLEKHLFIESFQTDSPVKLFLLFDGFDKICPEFEETVINLLKILKGTAVKQLWLTTRL